MTRMERDGSSNERAVLESRLAFSWRTLELRDPNHQAQQAQQPQAAHDLSNEDDSSDQQVFLERRPTVMRPPARLEPAASRRHLADDSEDSDGSAFFFFFQYLYNFLLFF